MKGTAKLGIGAVVAIALFSAASSAHAGAVITSGPVSLGIFDQGNLGFSSTGIALAGLGDGIVQECLCEGWGVSGSGAQGGADVAVEGISNLTLDSFVSTATTATSVVHLTSLPALSVTQAYAPSVGAPTVLFQDAVTITNTGGATITDLRYRRVMDWDIPPHVFHELVTIQGLPASALLFVNDDGFDSPLPLSGTFDDIGGCGTNVNFTDCGPADHGAHFDFGFGGLAAGTSKSFSIFYGAATSEAAALAALTAVGAEVYSFGQTHGEPGGHGDPVEGTPGTYIFAFKGVGGPPRDFVIPEPGSLLLLGMGMVSMVGSRRKRRSS